MWQWHRRRETKQTIFYFEVSLEAAQEARGAGRGGGCEVALFADLTNSRLLVSTRFNRKAAKPSSEAPTGTSGIAGSLYRHVAVEEDVGEQE